MKCNYSKSDVHCSTSMCYTFKCHVPMSLLNHISPAWLWQQESLPNQRELSRPCTHFPGFLDSIIFHFTHLGAIRRANLSKKQYS